MPFDRIYLSRLLMCAAALVGIFNQATAQISATFTTEINTNCNGNPCDYEGPTILINELMMSPTSFDGSLFGGSGAQAGEWIELYNPDLCNSIDISCYYLGNNAFDTQPIQGGNHPGGFVIPQGTVVPPAGFVVIRGINAPAVLPNLLIANGGNTIEIVVQQGVCIGQGSRLWFPNAGGWFAFYDNNGEPQDAVSWATAADVGFNPCVPVQGGCGFSGQLSNYTNIPPEKKNYITDQAAGNFLGQSIRRMPDGGTWSSPAPPTMGNCNSVCQEAGESTCTGSAFCLPLGGEPPYTFLWNDQEAQTTQTAVGLCAGVHCVTVTDSQGFTTNQCVTVTDEEFALDDGATLCQNEPFLLPNGTPITTPGVYPFNLISSMGCDSLVTYTVDFNPVFSETINAGLCDDAPYTLPDGTTTNVAGNYTFNFQTNAGCDSTYFVNLQVSPTYDLSFNAATCAGMPYVLPNGTAVSNGGTYINLLTTAAGCDSTVTVNLVVNPLPTLSTGVASGYCPYELNIPLTPSPAGGNLTGTFVQGLSLNHTSAVPGNYSVSYAYTDGNGCSATVTSNYVIPSPVQAAFAFTTYCSELTLVNATPPGNYTYTWSLDEELFSTQSNPIYLYTELGLFDVTLTVTDSYDCTYATTQEVELLESLDLTDFFIPNIITPNGDDINDSLKIKDIANDCLDYTLNIFNRWGQLVYEMTPESAPFAGKNEGGNELSPGVYYFVFETDRLDCETTPELKDWCRGTITIIRD